VFDQVETVHASDTRVRGRLEPVLLGTGVVPFDEVFRFLKSRGFDGWVCVEEASGMGREGIEKAVQFVRDRWATAPDGTPV
jgi:sugar phosphate isomerase/epimerase